MTWSLWGLAAALLLGIAAWRAAGTHAFYASEVYGMTGRSHRRFSYLCASLAAGFALSAAWSIIPVVALWAILILAALLYGTSFLRGYGDNDA